MARRRGSVFRILGACCLATVIFTLATRGAAPVAESSAEAVKKLQTRFKDLRTAARKDEAAKRFSPEWYQRADTLAKQASEALRANRFVEANNNFRKALWNLPALPPDGPGHIARVFGDGRLRHTHWVQCLA